MENQDKIFEQFKNAAQKAETKDFPEMEKIWSRVDAKLDTVVYKKQNKNWKKLAVAASVVLVGIILFQFYNTENQTVVSEEKVVVSDVKKDTLQEKNTNEDKIVSVEEKDILIKTDAEKILKRHIDKETKVAVLEEKEVEVILNKELEKAATHSAEKSKSIAETTSKNISNDEVRALVFEANVVRNSPQEYGQKANKNEEKQEIKNNPLVVFDGKAISSNKKSSEAIVSELDKKKFETVYLKEPLYIINGVQYSEESLFGKNPTSSYAPLDKQEIKTIKILQDEKDTAVYGEKGKKGVVIITTKTGKPVEKK